MTRQSFSPAIGLKVRWIRETLPGSTNVLRSACRKTRFGKACAYLIGGRERGRKPSCKVVCFSCTGIVMTWTSSGCGKDDLYVLVAYNYHRELCLCVVAIESESSD